MTLESWSAILLWMLCATTAVECALAVKGYLVERREGMPISFVRVIILVCIFAISLGVVLYVSRTPVPASAAQFSPGPSKPAPAEAESAERQRAQSELNLAQGELDDLKKQMDALTARERSITDRITKEQEVLGEHLSLPTWTLPQQSQDQQHRSMIGLTIMALLAVIGVVVLAFGGQLHTLLPEGWSWGARGQTQDRQALERNLEELANKVWNEQYRDGLTIAGRIPEGKLGAFESLDLKFLRAYCAIQLYSVPGQEDASEKRVALLEKSIEDLESVVERAPKRGEALYTLALAYGLADKPSEALTMFERSRRALGSTEKLPYDHNISCTLLQLGEKGLSTGDTQAAEGYFGRVSKLGTLGEFVAHSRLRIGVINIRDAMGKQDVSSASATLQKIAGMSDLGDEQRKQVSVIGAALRARIALRQDDPEKALAEATEFFDKHMLAGLPPLDDESADETFSPILDADLGKIPREVFQGFLLIQAVAMSCVETKPRRRLTEMQVAKLSQPLLRGLQFTPRERELLGAIGGLYYWFQPEKRDKAREWLESASMMGSSSRIVRKILEHDRLVEVERREALDWFRSASSRFLRDPSIAADVRRALVEELGRFQEFVPMLISLRDLPELEPEAPTIELLQDRARYLAELVASFSRRGNSERSSRLAQIHAEYTASLTNLEHSSNALREIELRVYREISDSLILS